MKMMRIGFVFLISWMHICAYGQSSPGAGSIKFEFINQNIPDILYVFSTYAGISILTDDTVSGTATFQFAGVSFGQAFDAFLLANRLYVEKRTDLWLVSRIVITTPREGYITLDALDVSPVQLLDRVSQKARKAIVQDILPAAKLSLHLEDVPVSEAVVLIMKPFSDYSVQEHDAYIQVKKEPVQPYSTTEQRAGGVIAIQDAGGGRYDAVIEQARLGDVLEQFFSIAGKEYTSFTRSDQIIERVGYSGKEFQEALNLIMEQAASECTDIQGRWYIFPLQQSEIIKQRKEEGKTWRRYTATYLPLTELLPLVVSRFPNRQTIAVAESATLLVLLDEVQAIEVQEYIRMVDIPKESTAVKLKYIKTEYLLKALPPSVRREEIIDAGNGSTIFFVGSTERLALFQKDLEVIDRPQTRIRYDLFIVQYQETSALNWDFSVSARPMQPGDMMMVTGEFGNLMNLNFDVITVFGYQFAARINAEITKNQANIFADTTLYGLSGEDIKFQNTNTYRYRDSNIDPETGKPIYSGITREIISGLMLDINGWVSGDGMITTTITASVSKRGADVTSTIGNPPPTSEKVLTTQVRSRSGEPVILSGLRQNDETIIESRGPLIGWLFRSKRNSSENTEMVIYLVPHIDLANDEYTVEGLKTASIYNRLVAPFLEAAHE